MNLKKKVAAGVASAAAVATLGLGATAAMAHHCVWSGGAWIGGINCEHEGEARISGANRYETAVAISEQFWEPGEAANVYLANGTTFADAVVAGATVDGPILLVPTGDSLPDSVLNELGRLDPTVAVVALGGTSAVSNDQLSAASIAAGFGN